VWQEFSTSPSCSLLLQEQESGLTLTLHVVHPGAVLCRAVLCRAVPCCAVLCCAVLCCAVPCCAVLCRAVLCCAVLCCAVLCCAVLCCAVQVLAVANLRLKSTHSAQTLLSHFRREGSSQTWLPKQAAVQTRVSLVGCGPGDAKINLCVSCHAATKQTVRPYLCIVAACCRLPQWHFATVRASCSRWHLLGSSSLL